LSSTKSNFDKATTKKVEEEPHNNKEEVNQFNEQQIAF